MAMRIETIVLDGNFVRLEPLSGNHLEALCRVGLDEEIWRWSPTDVKTSEDMSRYIETALDEQAAGVSLPFATIEKQSKKVVGSTRFGNIDPKNRRAEIGWTWIGRKWQRTFVNTEAKFLMLRYAFEVWKCVRVELKTDVLNEKSRKAVERLGAKQEGVLRKHIITDSGRFRDTVYYSILDDEWIAVKTNLEVKLGL
jgi:N-acetyltransferase